MKKPTLETKTQFAARLGCDKSHVTRLDQAGRLVMQGEGRKAKVYVEASLQRIKDTEGGRDDVAARHAAAKGKDIPKPNESRVDAQTREQMAKADIAEMERDKMRGELVNREQVEQALGDVVAIARQAFENFPHRVAAALVGKDFEQIVAILKQEVQAQIGDTHSEARRWLTELTKVGV